MFKRHQHKVLFKGQNLSSIHAPLSKIKTKLHALHLATYWYIYA